MKVRAVLASGLAIILVLGGCKSQVSRPAAGKIGYLSQLPWFGYGEGDLQLLPGEGQVPPEIIRLARENPSELFARGLEYHHQNVRDYHCRLLRQELQGGKMLSQQEVDTFVLEKPFAVYMNWLRNPQRVKKILYIEGENQGKVLVKPMMIGLFTPGGIPQDPQGKDAKDASRRPITEFGLGKMLGRINQASRTGQLSAGGTFVDRYAGVAQVYGREAVIIERLRTSGPELLTEVAANFRIGLDSQTMLPIVVTEFGADGTVLGHYVFLDLRLNQGLTLEQLKKKFRQ